VITSYLDGQVVGRRFGSASPDIVALPGWGRTSQDWTPVLTGFNAIALDLPGFGLSPAPSQAWSTRDYATNVLELMADLGGPVVVLGHSFGGRVALHVADIAPTRVAHLILTGVPFSPPAGGQRKPDLRYRAARFLHRRGLLPEGQFRKVQNHFGSADYRNATGVMRGVLVQSVSERYQDQLDRLSVPTQLIWGDQDTAAPLAMAQDAAAVTGAVLTVVAGEGHMLPLSRPEIFRTALTAVTPLSR
jgi:pimeloyl-ACP methyl ester carboxylesterase